MQSKVLRSLICGAGLLLCGCNQEAPVAAAPTPRPAPATAQFANLPAGAACTDKIRRYQSILAADAATGNLERKVYAVVEQELAQAAAACAAGHGDEALRLVRLSEERHGYHV